MSKGEVQYAATEAIKNRPELAEVGYKHSRQIIDSYNKDWLIPFLHSSSWHTTPTIEEGLSFSLICDMIANGVIYLCFIDMPDWAQPNECLSENTELLSTSDVISVHLQNSPQGSDGYVQLKEELTLFKLYLSESETPSLIPSITLPIGTIFPIEIGTNSVHKTWLYFRCDSMTLATFPFNVPKIHKTPKLAMFYVDVFNSDIHANIFD